MKQLSKTASELLKTPVTSFINTRIITSTGNNKRSRDAVEEEALRQGARSGG